MNPAHAPSLVFQFAFRDAADARYGTSAAIVEIAVSFVRGRPSAAWDPSRPLLTACDRVRQMPATPGPLYLAASPSPAVSLLFRPIFSSLLRQLPARLMVADAYLAASQSHAPRRRTRRPVASRRLDGA
jgi:hypothetical protein